MDRLCGERKEKCVMKFSVLMSVYYKENPKYLKDAIESVLNQTVKADEIVIIKDGKLTVELDMILEEYTNKYKGLFKIIEFKSNRGLGVALREGVLSCSNEIIARMDTDDIARKDRFEKQLKILNDKNLDIVGSNIAEFDGEITNIISNRTVPENSKDIKLFSKKRNPFNHMTVMYRKDAVLKAGNYEEFLWFEDYNLWVRMFMAGAKAYNIQENLVNARTGREMFARRGGFKYIKQEVNMQNFMLRKKYISYKEYIVNLFERMMVRVMPNKLRGIIYLKLLR